MLRKIFLKIYINARENEASYLEEKMKHLPGIIDVRVSSINGLTIIEYNLYTLTRNKVYEYIDRMGYRVLEEERVRVKREIISLGMRRVLAFTLAITILIIHFTGFLDGLLDSFTINLFKTVLTIFVIVLSYDIIYTGLRALTKLSPIMNSLIALSAITTFTYSLAVLIYSSISKNPATTLFFESSAGVLGFVSLGRYIEEKIEKKAFSRFEELAKRLEGRVRVLRGEERIEIDVEEVKPNDLVEIRSGEKILVDGIVVEGEGYVDESIFTGEPEPRLKKSVERDPVLAGSILVNGYLIVRATRIGKDTVLSKMMDIAKSAQFIKPRFQRIADRIVGYLTWIVILLATTTFIYWFLFKGVDLGLALLFTTAVLAVTCPCPLGLAIPLVVAISIIKSMDIGLLVRRGDLFEKTRYTNIVFFDKTGTLTYGEFTVIDIVPHKYSLDELLRYICIAEKRSEHLIAKAIMDYCSKRDINPPDPDMFTPLPGLGVIAEYRGHRIIVGSHNLLREMNIEIIEDVLQKPSSITGKTIYVVLNDKLIGYIIVGDRLREEAKHVVETLHRRGYRTGILTGDTESTAKSVADELGIDYVWAELRPEEKARVVEEYQSKGFKIIYVGDGVNDAVAMAKSFIGIAMGGGADILREAGDAVIVNDKLSTLIDLLDLGKATRKKFLENLGWAFAYNSILIPVAMGMLYEPFNIMLRPEYAALAMIMSDISVIINSMLLFRWKRREA